MADLVRKHIMLNREDWDFINENFGQDSDSKIRPSEAVRNIVHAAVRQLKARINAAQDEVRG